MCEIIKVVWLIEDVHAIEWMCHREKFITFPDFTTDPHDEYLAEFKTKEEADAEIAKIDLEKIERELIATEHEYFK